MGLDSLPSSSFAMTMPLPALAEKRKPALKMVNIAKPFAFSSTLRGMTCGPSDADEHLTDLKEFQKTHPVETIVPTVDERLDCAARSGCGCSVDVEANIHICAALAHSLGRGWGSGVLNFMRRAYASSGCGGGEM